MGLSSEYYRTIQAKVIALTTVLAALVCWDGASNLLGQWRLYQEAQFVLKSNELVDDLLQAAQNLAFERGRTNVLLRSPTAVTPEQRSFIQDRRAAASRHMDPALTQLRDGDIPHLARLRTAYADMQALRHDVDVALGFPVTQRDPSLADRWVRSASALLRSMADLVSSVALQRRESTSEFRIFSRIKVAAFQLRDDAGLESSRLATAITAGTALTPSAIAEISALRGRTQAHWAILQREISLSGSAALVASLHSVQDQFLEGFRPLEDRVAAAGIAAQPYPVSSKDYMAASVPALDSIANLMSTATSETQHYATSNMRKAQRGIIVYAVQCAASIAAALFAIFYIVFRLFLPLRRIQASLGQLAAGHIDVPFNANANPDEIGALGRAVVAFRDSLQQRQRMEDFLRDREELNKALMNATSDAAFLLDRDGIVRAANQSLLDRLGQPAERIIGRHHSLVFSDAEPMARERAIQTVFRDALPARLQDERKGMVLDNTLYPVLGTDGQVQSIAVFSREITAQLRAQQQLQTTLDELSRSNQELESFAYAASHDLRQPLRMISSFLSLTMRRMGAALDDDTKSFMNFAINGAGRMDQMITDLLDYSRIGRQNQTLSAVDLTDILACVHQTLAPMIADCQATIRISPNLPTINGQALELERLFQNLLSNALKFHAADRPPIITVDCLRDGAMWVIAVRDNGIGMDPDHMPRLFSVFQRLVSQDQYEGTGIGLATCRKICQNHHGRIWAESKPGEGSVFYVALPVLEGDM